MDNSRWQKVETIFHSALTYHGAEREQYLVQTCDTDSVALNEVQSLLAAFEKDAEFLENPVSELTLSVIGEEAEQSRANIRCGFYEIREKLGSGGMGEVYAAIDVKLNRQVALKFLSNDLKNDNFAKRQLQREAQAVAMLEHPNICAVYGIEQIGDENFIVMQFVEGMTLDKKLKISTITTETFISLAKQLGGAIAYAHSHGVIHRDLKSGNIMVAADGTAKVLDFGLAKIIRPQPLPVNDRAENTSQFSQNGVIIGTVSYMSPEQLRGEKLDFQTDIFSLGIIFYELLAGQNPFHRATHAETIAAILSDDSIRAETITSPPPANISNLINKCLAKDKRQRFQSVAEILVELEKTNAPRHFKLTFKKHLGVNNFLLLGVLFLLLLTWGMFAYRNQSAKIPTLAILPITNATDNPEIEYLSDGLTEELINKFSKFRSLKIKSSAVVSKYKGQPIDPQVVGNNLQADVLMLGKIIKRENSLIFQANLVNAVDGTELWGKDYKIDRNDLVTTQDEVITQITEQLKLNVSKEEVIQLGKGQTTSAEAEEQYFRGLYYLNNRSRTNIDKAIEHFNQAIDFDPLYARAYAGLADSYVFKSSPAFGSLTPKDSMLKAKAAVSHALQSDTNLSEAYNTLGLIKLKYEWNWLEAESNFVKAIELDPTSAPPHFWYSQLLIHRKDFVRALAEAQKAQELDPLSSNNEVNVGRIYYYERQNDQAIQILSPILHNNPSNRGAAYMLGLTYLQKGLYAEAINLFERFYENDKLYFAAQLGYAYGKMNRKADAQRILDDLEKISAKGEEFVPPQEKALIYLGMGGGNQAFNLFRQSCEERFGSFPYILTEHYFDDWQSDPDYIALTNCVKPLN